MTVPEILGLSSCISFSSAMMDAYSVPCAASHQGESRPGLRAANDRNRDIRAHVAPRRNTSTNPVTVYPVTAVAVPTVSVGCCAVAATHRTQLKRINASRLRISRLLHTTLESRQSITPPVESYTGPAARATNLHPRLARDKRQHS